MPDKCLDAITATSCSECENFHSTIGSGSDNRCYCKYNLAFHHYLIQPAMKTSSILGYLDVIWMLLELLLQPRPAKMVIEMQQQAGVLLTVARENMGKLYSQLEVLFSQQLVRLAMHLVLNVLEELATNAHRV